jgi:hypothetical protein
MASVVRVGAVGLEYPSHAPAPEDGGGVENEGAARTVQMRQVEALRRVPERSCQTR